MEQKKLDDFSKSPIVQDMILSSQIGIISAEISRRLNVSPEKALSLFYESQTCANLHNKATGLYMLSNSYIADEFLIEYGKEL